MKRVCALLICATAAGFVVRAAGPDTFLLRNVDVYPVTSTPVKGSSILVQNGKIAEIGTKIVAPKDVRVIDRKSVV